MEKYVLSDMTNNNFSKAVFEIYQITDYNKDQYPSYYKWFYGKTVPGVLEHKRNIIFYLDGFEIVGLTILKKDDEKKICTFMINPSYRKRGYSKLLLEDAYDYLGTQKPIITIPEFRLDEFKSIIDVYDWKESKIIDSYYSKELEFNGKKR